MVFNILNLPFLGPSSSKLKCHNRPSREKPMFYYAPRRNAIAYLLWRFLLSNSGSFVAWFDAFFFGPSRGMNDYDLLAASYKKSAVKPDKRYSILPTVLKMVGDCTGKTVIDMGCGTGFFTLPLAELGASTVCGVDNSREQIKIASRASPHSAIHYTVGDIFIQHGGPVDVINAPFVVNYARTIPTLRHFFGLVHSSLRKDGKAVFVVDLPNGKNLERFGAAKTLLGPHADETVIRINLSNEERKICSLTAVFYTPQTIGRLLRKVGFRNICWHRPVVSEEGIRVMGADFWKDYTADPELGYLTAEK